MRGLGSAECEYVLTTPAPKEGCCAEDTDGLECVLDDGSGSAMCCGEEPFMCMNGCHWV